MKNKTSYTLSDLENSLGRLKEIINNFDNKKIYLDSESYHLIQTLEKRKGNFLGIKYSKTPTSEELLDVSRSICNSTTQALAEVCKQIEDLHKVNQNIFTLFMVLNQLTNINQQRLVGAYSLIDNAQKDIRENSKQTSVLGNQLKDMVLMHLQHVKNEKRFRFFNSITYKIIVGVMALSALICSLYDKYLI